MKLVHLEARKEEYELEAGRFVVWCSLPAPPARQVLFASLTELRDRTNGTTTQTNRNG